MRSTCVIIDDEPLAVELMEAYVSKIPQLELVVTCSSALDAYEVLKTKEIDLLFLDIQMPNITGIEFLRSISNPPKVILTTAYREYALESYDLEVVDYLLKPIPFDRFFKAVDKFFKTVNTTVQSKQQTIIEGVKRDYLFVNVNKKHHKLYYDEILYAESLKDYIRIHTLDQVLVTKQKISDFETLLPMFFLRTHRSYIVNIHKVTAYTQQDVEIGKIEIPIGISYKKEVIDTLRLD